MGLWTFDSDSLRSESIQMAVTVGIFVLNVVWLALVLRVIVQKLRAMAGQAV